MDPLDRRNGISPMSSTTRSSSEATTPFTTSRTQPTQFATLGSDEFSPFIINLETSDYDQEIESLYGPFETNSYSSPGTSSPRLSNNQPSQTAYGAGLHEAINILKARIAARQGQTTKAVVSPSLQQSSTPTTPETQPKDTQSNEVILPVETKKPTPSIVGTSVTVGKTSSSGDSSNMQTRDVPIEKKTELLPTGPASQTQSLPTGPARQSQPLPTGPASHSPPLPTGPARQSHPLPTGPASQSHSLPTGPARQSHSLPTGPSNQARSLPTSPAKQTSVTRSPSISKIPTTNTALRDLRQQSASHSQSTITIGSQQRNLQLNQPKIPTIDPTEEKTAIPLIESSSLVNSKSPDNNNTMIIDLTADSNSDGNDGTENEESGNSDDETQIEEEQSQYEMEKRKYDTRIAELKPKMADIDDQMEWINEERQKLLKYIDRLKNGNKSDISQHRQTQQRQQQQIPQQRKQQKQQQQQQKVTSNLPVRIQQKGPTITPARHPILAPISSPLPPFSERERHIITPHVELVPTVYENRSRKVNVHPDFELKQSSRKRQKSNINIPVQSNDYDSDFPRLQSNTSISYAGASTSYTENAKTTEMNTFVPRSLPRPLYPIVRTTPKPKSLTKITPLQQGMEVAAYIQNMCSMIRIRMVYKRDVPVKLGHHLPLPLPLPPPRQMARLNQLVTIGDITFTLDSIRPRRNQLLDSNGMEKRKNDQYYESLFYTIWEDEEPSFIASWPMECKKQVASIINQISIQTKLAIDSLGPGEAISEDHHIILDKAIEQTLQLANTYQDNELIWVLYTELALYRYGRSRKLADICTQALQHHHLSIDIHWTMIRSTSDDVKRNLLIIELLKLISSSRKNANFNGTLESVSDATTEILLRCLRKDGLTGILGHLLPASNVKQLYESIAHLPSIRLSMQDIPEHVYLLDHDVCYLWLLIVYHYVFKSLPFDNSRKHWFHRQRQTNTDQPPEDYKNTLFVTDWSVLEKDENKLTGIEQGTVTLIQVEMMKHFCSKTRSNAAKKPLLIAVWRTLMEFLMYQEQYHITGTLLLLKHELTTGLALKPLQPEFIDMIMDLEHKKDIRNSQAWNIITNDHLSLVGSVRQKRDRIPHGLYLAYRWAVLKKLDQQHTHADLLNLAWQLGRPLWYIYNEQTLEKLDSMMMDASTGSDRGLQKVGEIQQINYICGLYSTALGVSDSFGMLLSPLFKKNEFSELGMAWCVAVLVHYIHSLMTLDQQLLNSFLDSTMNLGFLDHTADSDTTLVLKQVCDDIHFRLVQ